MVCRCPPAIAGRKISRNMDWLAPLFYILVLVIVPWVLLPGRRDRIFHVVAGLYLLLGVFLLISLISYSPDARPYQNWGGVVGHFSGKALVSSVGFAMGYGLIGLCFAAGIMHYFKKLTIGNLFRAYALLLALLSVTTAFPATGGSVQFAISDWLLGFLGWGRFLALGLIFVLLLWPYWWMLGPVKNFFAGVFSGLKLPRFRNPFKRKRVRVDPNPTLDEGVFLRPEDRISSEVVKVGKVPGEGHDEVVGPGETGFKVGEDVLGREWETGPGPDPLRRDASERSYSGTQLDLQGLVRLFNEPPESEDQDETDSVRIGRLIEEKLAEFGVSGKVVKYFKGPVVTRYEYEPAPGIKLSRVVSLADDLALRIKALSVRMVAPLPGKGLIGIEVPNPRRRVVYFRQLLDREEFLRSNVPLYFALGVDPGGEPHYESLTRMPHLLIAGTTGSGKSVCINTLLACFLMSYRHSQLRLVLVDPKRVELSFYEGVPNLLLPVIKDRKQAGEALKKAVAWMEIRYRHFAKEGVRDIESHNRTAAQRGDDPIPYIVIVIDEFADLMLTMGKEIEEPMARLAQMARAVGIHLVVATQRPSVDVITGIIKANFPVRIAFKVPSKVDSRTILDEMGAEKLLGKGDMLFIPPGTSEPARFHGPYVSEEETQRLSAALTADYLAFRLEEAFGDGKPDGIRQWTDWIVGQGLTPALTRSDEPGAEDRLMLVAEHGARLLELDPEHIADTLTEMRSGYYIPIEEMGEAPVEEVSEEAAEFTGDLDSLIPDAARLIVARGQGSATMLQRKLKVGFARAARIMDQLEEMGIVEPAEGTKSRKPMIGPEELENRLRGMGL